MKRYTPDELAEILRLHRMYRFGEKGGARANLAGANLAGANLDGANLDGANLAGANLAGANLAGANLAGANLAGANLAGANLDGANLAGANLDGANLAGANLDGARLAGANLDGANLDGANRIFSLEVFSGLYKYTCWAFATVQGVPWVRMGCLWKTVGDWDAIGIRKSNLREFPDNGSESSERRARAFEFTRAAALCLAEKAKKNPLRLEAETPAPFAENDQVQLTEAARKSWPWAPEGPARVMVCRSGWTRLDFPSCYISAPNRFLERVPALVAEKEGA